MLTAVIDAIHLVTPLATHCVCLPVRQPFHLSHQKGIKAPLKSLENPTFLPSYHPNFQSQRVDTNLPEPQVFDRKYLLIDPIRYHQPLKMPETPPRAPSPPSATDREPSPPYNPGSPKPGSDESIAKLEREIDHQKECLEVSDRYYDMGYHDGLGGR